MSSNVDCKVQYRNICWLTNDASTFRSCWITLNGFPFKYIRLMFSVAYVGYGKIFSNNSHENKSHSISNKRVKHEVAKEYHRFWNSVGTVDIQLHQTRRKPWNYGENTEWNVQTNLKYIHNKNYLYFPVSVITRILRRMFVRMHFYYINRYT